MHLDRVAEVVGGIGRRVSGIGVWSWALLVPLGANAQVDWQPLTLDQALQQAYRTQQKVMIDVWAEHCGQCKQMEIDLWETPTGAKLSEGLIAIKVNSTTPDGQAFMSRYPVTGLPVVIFLNPDGTEFDRVQGYMSTPSFLAEARPISQGLDALPIMEAQLSAKPDSLPLMFALLEKYLNRQRDDDGKEMLTRILARDPQNARGIAERATGHMAKYLSYFRHNDQAAFDHWKIVVERFPKASSIGGAIDGSYKCAAAIGKQKEWTSWLCAEAKKNPTAGQLNYSAAMTGYKYGILDPCLAVAARAARKQGVGSAKLDTIAIEMERGRR